MITFTQSGKKYSAGHEERIRRIFSAAKWLDIKPGLSLPMAQGEAIKEIIRTTPGRHTACSIHNSFNFADGDEVGYGEVIGLKTHYKNGEAVSLWLDYGCGVCSLAVDFTEAAHMAAKVAI